MLNKYTLSIFLLLTSFVTIAQPTAFTNCPNANVAVARAGSGGATTNPFSIYTMNSNTGAATLLSGPILDPANATISLQINGVGLNEGDGFLYGMYSDAPATLSLTPTTPYYRLGANATAVQLGTFSGPTPPGTDNASFVFPNAGEFDQSGNYYFAATTGFVTLNLFNLPASTFDPSTFYIGSLAGSSALGAGTAALSPSYVAITNPSNDAAAYLAASSATITATSAQGLGLQDLVYNETDGHIYTYVTYPDTASSGYFGQMLKINPTTGIMSAVAPPALQTFISATVFPNGTLIDASGNFLVMLTNGDIYQASGTSANYTGALTLLNTTSGLPASLTGDLASCGILTFPLPHNDFHFTIKKRLNSVDIFWTKKNEKNVASYEVEFSLDGQRFEKVAKLFANNSSEYFYNHTNLFLQSQSFYRIKVVDVDGNETYSFIKVIESEAANIKIFPNPVTESLTLNLPEDWIGEAVHLEIMNSLGQVVFAKNIQTAQYSERASLADLHPGVYSLRLSSGELLHTQRIIKN